MAEYTESSTTLTDLPPNLKAGYDQIIDTDIKDIRKLFEDPNYRATADWGLGYVDDKGNPVEPGTPGAKIRPMSKHHELGMAALTDNNPFDYFDKSDAMFDKYANTGSHFAGRSVDGVADYMLPFLENVLQPQIREQRRAFQAALNNLGNEAHMANAFGDAAHGVGTGLTSDRHFENVNDIVGKGYADAWIDAVTNNRLDLQRKEAEANKASERVLRGGQALSNNATQRFNANNVFGSNMLELGNFEKNALQDAANQKWREDNNELLGKQAKTDYVTRVFGNIRVPQSTTTTTTKPDNTAYNIAGAIGNRFLDGVFGGGS